MSSREIFTPPLAEDGPVDPKDPALLYKINPQIFKDYKQADKSEINTKDFLQAVKKLPFLLAQTTTATGPIVPKSHYMDKSILANALYHCNLSI